MRITSWTFLFGAQEEMPIVKLMVFSRNVKKKNPELFDQAVG